LIKFVKKILKSRTIITIVEKLSNSLANNNTTTKFNHELTNLLVKK